MNTLNCGQVWKGSGLFCGFSKATRSILEKACIWVWKNHTVKLNKALDKAFLENFDKLESIYGCTTPKFISINEKLFAELDIIIEQYCSRLIIKKYQLPKILINRNMNYKL